MPAFVMLKDQGYLSFEFRLLAPLDRKLKLDLKLLMHHGK